MNTEYLLGAHLQTQTRSDMREYKLRPERESFELQGNMVLPHLERLEAMAEEFYIKKGFQPLHLERIESMGLAAAENHSILIYSKLEEKLSLQVNLYRNPNGRSLTCSVEDNSPMFFW